VEPKKALQRRLKQLEEDSFELERKIRESLPTLQLQYSLKHDIIQGVVSEIIVGNNSSSKNIQETLTKALSEVLVVAADFDVKPHEVEVLKRLLERGVSVRVLCSDVGKHSKPILDRLLNLGLNIRMQDGVAEKYYVMDNKYTTMFLQNFDENVCLQIHCSALCRVLKERFEEKWKTARIMKTKTYESTTPEPIGEEKAKL
jgi:sugar-specific transcriptional regulator TrmB